jgi:hypothetical protein
MQVTDHRAAAQINQVVSQPALACSICLPVPDWAGVYSTATRSRSLARRSTVS